MPLDPPVMTANFRPSSVFMTPPEANGCHSEGSHWSPP
jgi:hypothetical protein